MKSHSSPLLWQENSRFLLEPSNHPLHSGLKVLHGDLGAGVPCSDQGSLVTNIGHVSPGESVGECGEILCESLSVFFLSLDFRQMDLKDLSTASDVRKRHLNVSIKSTGSEKGRVNGVQSVGGTKNNDLSLNEINLKFTFRI